MKINFTQFTIGWKEIPCKKNNINMFYLPSKVQPSLEWGEIVLLSTFPGKYIKENVIDQLCVLL